MDGVKEGRRRGDMTGEDRFSNAGRPDGAYIRTSKRKDPILMRHLDTAADARAGKIAVHYTLVAFIYCLRCSNKNISAENCNLRSTNFEW